MPSTGAAGASVTPRLRGKMGWPLWSCWPCVGLLLAALGPEVAWASQLRLKETVHRVDKVHVTTQLHRRDDTLCPANYSLCPSSMSGGCCPDRYGCATDSCVATTAGTTSACGTAGYYACGSNVGGLSTIPARTLLERPSNTSVCTGGCCPEGSKDTALSRPFSSVLL